MTISLLARADAVPMVMKCRFRPNAYFSFVA
jgi:hypothetical protein